MKRPANVQTVLLKRHLLELTHSFMIPLERYIASCMPLQKNISPFKVCIIGLYTDHCSLKYYMSKLGPTDKATCRLCKGAEETAQRILCTCDAISLKRLLNLGKANLPPEEVVSVAPRQAYLLRKSRATGRAN